MGGAPHLGSCIYKYGSCNGMLYVVNGQISLYYLNDNLYGFF